MDKLTRYNQKLLATIGTTAIVAISLAIIVGLGGFIFSLIDSSDFDDNGLRIQNPQLVDNDSIELVRTQEVTFNSPYQLDTAQAKYIIPVGQVNLKSEERIRFEKGGSILNLGSYDYSYESHYGLFNNFIYFDHSKGFTKKLFNEKVAVTHWAFLKKDTIEVLLFKGTTTDDNLDNKLDGADFQSLFAYYVSSDELKRYSFENETVLGFEPMNKTELIAIRLGVDTDKNSDFESSNEPQLITTLNVATRGIQEIISTEVQTEIQNIIDGVSE